MDKTKINVQEQVLNVSRKERIPVEVTLIGGQRLKGQIQSFDANCILLKLEDEREIMLYKQAIASLLPLQPLPVTKRESFKEE